MKKKITNIHWTFFKKFISLLFKNTINQILLFLDIIGWIISLFPNVTIPPLGIVLMNGVVFSIITIFTLFEKKYKVLSEPEATLLEHTYHINALAISPDEKKLASCGGDNYAILWDNVERKVLLRIPHDGWVGNIAFSPNNLYLYTVTGKNGLFRAWNVKTGISINTVEHPKKNESRGLAVNPSGTRVMISNKDGSFRSFDPIDTHYVSMLIPISDVEIRKICISKTGRIAAANIKGEIFLITIGDDGNYLSEIIYQDENKEMIRNISFNLEGLSLAFTNSGGFLKILDIENKEIISTKAHNGHAIAVAFSPDDQYVATGGQDNLICIWKLKKGSLVKYFEIHGHTDDVTSLVFDHHGHLYSASRDSSIKIWNLKGLQKDTSINSNIV